MDTTILLLLFAPLVGFLIKIFFGKILGKIGPVIFGTLFLFTLLGLILRLISDVLYQVIDPRINFDSRGVK